MQLTDLLCLMVVLVYLVLGTGVTLQDVHQGAHAELEMCAVQNGCAETSLSNDVGHRKVVIDKLQFAHNIAFRKGTDLRQKMATLPVLPFV